MLPIPCKFVCKPCSTTIKILLWTRELKGSDPVAWKKEKGKEVAGSEAMDELKEEEERAAEMEQNRASTSCGGGEAMEEETEVKEIEDSEERIVEKVDELKVEEERSEEGRCRCVCKPRGTTIQILSRTVPNGLDPVLGKKEVTRLLPIVMVLILVLFGTIPFVLVLS